MYIPIYIVLLLGRLTNLKKNTLGWQCNVMAGLAIALLETDIDTIPSSKANYENTFYQYITFI